MHISKYTNIYAKKNSDYEDTYIKHCTFIILVFWFLETNKNKADETSNHRTSSTSLSILHDFSQKNMNTH